MACKNLKAELAREEIAIEELAKLLNVHRNSVANKLNGVTAFTIDEAFLIQETYFPNLSLGYLFEREKLVVTATDEAEVVGG